MESRRISIVRSNPPFEVQRSTGRYTMMQRYVMISAMATLLIVGARGSALAQTEWERHPDNPVLRPGPEAWDSWRIASPTVLHDGTEYKMWYDGTASSPECYSIGLATSSDGKTWDKYDGNPVLGLGNPGEWDDYMVVGHPIVIFDGMFPDSCRYKMWYHGYDWSHYRIGYAYSADGIVWVEHPDNPVFDIGLSGRWDDHYVFGPAVLFDGTEYKMWYIGMRSDYRYQIGYATSQPPDTAPPEISISLDPDELWPPNHKMRTVTATVTVTDDYDPDPVVVLASIVSNEPDDGPGDGDTPDDIEDAEIGEEDYVFSLRAERSGKGNGRDYTITYTASDASGNEASASATVTVPHDRGRKEKKRRSKVLLPGDYVLQQNVPNPFNPSTEITYALPERSWVRLIIYNLRGQEIARLVDKEQPAGYYTVVWNASGMSGGVYLCRMVSGEFNTSRKLVLLR